MNSQVEKIELLEWKIKVLNKVLNISLKILEQPKSKKHRKEIKSLFDEQHSSRILFEDDDSDNDTQEHRIYQMLRTEVDQNTNALSASEQQKYVNLSFLAKVIYLIVNNPGSSSLKDNFVVLIKEKLGRYQQELLVHTPNADEEETKKKDEKKGEGIWVLDSTARVTSYEPSSSTRDVDAPSNESSSQTPDVDATPNESSPLLNGVVKNQSAETTPCCSTTLKTSLAATAWLSFGGALLTTSAMVCVNNLVVAFLIGLGAPQALVIAAQVLVIAAAVVGTMMLVYGLYLAIRMLCAAKPAEDLEQKLVAEKNTTSFYGSPSSIFRTSTDMHEVDIDSQANQVQGSEADDDETTGCFSSCYAYFRSCFTTS